MSHLVFWTLLLDTLRQALGPVKYSLELFSFLLKLWMERVCLQFLLIKKALKKVSYLFIPSVWQSVEGEQWRRRRRQI